jgi:hypothetical protein
MLEDAMTELARSEVRLRRETARTQRQIARTDRMLARLAAEQSERDARVAAEQAERDTRLRTEQAERDARVTTERAERDARFDARMEEIRLQSRRDWGELSRRLGTMAEDLVAPSVPGIMRHVLGVGEPIRSAVRVREFSTADPSLRREFDVVARGGGYLLVNETKSSLDAKDVDSFVAVLSTVRDFFPEHAADRVVGAIASLYVDPSLVRHAERAGLIVLGFGNDLMDVLNSPGFVPREF